MIFFEYFYVVGHLVVEIASILLELFLRFPSQVSDQPLGSEGILRGHPVTHYCVQESLPLARVETQNLKKVSV